MFYSPKNRALLCHVWEWNGEDLIIDTIKRLKPKVLIFDCTTEYNFRPCIETPEFKKITNQVIKHKIDAFLLLGSFSEKSYKFNLNYYASPFKVKFLPTYFLYFTDFNLKYRYNQNLKKNRLFYMQVNRPHEHRCKLIDQLARFDLLDSRNYSWNLTTQEYNHSGNYKFEYWKEKSKIAKDNYISEENDSFRKPERSYFTSVFDLVSETTTECIFYTEKTFKPILLGKPFIIYGAKDSNKSLQDLGFKLHDNVVDYNFDSEKNDIRRAELLGKELLRLSKFPLLELDETLRLTANYNMDRAREIIKDETYIQQVLQKSIVYNPDINLGILDYLYLDKSISNTPDQAE